ncbi:MAG: hypothetical protein DBX55_05055, partial [Verrucomicrobia bacterium]
RRKKFPNSNPADKSAPKPLNSRRFPFPISSFKRHWKLNVARRRKKAAEYQSACGRLMYRAKRFDMVYQTFDFFYMHNREHLVDIANLAMIEFATHPDYPFHPSDDGVHAA